MIVQTEFGERFRQLREEADLTMEQLAASLGTKKQTISRYENNQREPEYATLMVVQKRLCKPQNPVKIKLIRRFFYG